jgi:GMP synthase (glutamine-hydrolysing)
MAHIAVVHHNRELGVGRLAPFLAHHRVMEVWAPERVFPHEADAVVVMGGFMAAYQEDLHPWLEDEKRWIATRVGNDTPLLGICLGAQLLADATGGHAYQAPRPEVGVVDLILTEAGARHRVASQMGRRAFFAHQDTFDLPAAATLLASTASYPAVFEVGSALGIQPHPETPPDEALHWADDPRFDLPQRAGVSRVEYEMQLKQHAGEAETAARHLFGAWFDALGRA